MKSITSELNFEIYRRFKKETLFDAPAPVMNVNLPGLESKGFILREPSEGKKPDGAPPASEPALANKPPGAIFNGFCVSAAASAVSVGEPSQASHMFPFRSSVHTFSRMNTIRVVWSSSARRRAARAGGNMCCTPWMTSGRDGSLGKRDNALHPQQMRAMGRAQQFEKHIDRCG